ncbi:DEAD/DEAH box helicase [Photobacterium sp. 53610]|uniref:DEAD/DEAH box helicase n=1 Tax=Photobacterium sp. 53610 TaxID=3102789 RepID=UPI002EDA1911
MQASPLAYLKYYRRCYREDSHDLSLSNVLKIRQDRRLWIREEENLLSGKLPRQPVVDKVAEEMAKQVDLYRREKRLIYGSLMIKGQINITNGITAQRQLFSPLIYLPAELILDDVEHRCVQVDVTDIRLNNALLRQILNPEIDPQVIDTFPEPVFPLTDIYIAQVGHWLGTHCQVQRLESLARWPFLECASETMKISGTDNIELVCASGLFLADRSRGSRGVLHELNLMQQRQSLSQPLMQLFHLESHREKQQRKTTSHACHLPYQLSLPQQQALKNAALQPLSILSGPPGTGKSFTIAAMAIDRMMHGESVLIVAKTDQAIDVIAEKLRDGFGLEGGFVHANSTSFNKTMRQYLESILLSGQRVTASQNDNSSQQLKQTGAELAKVEKEFSRALWIARYASGHNSGTWLQKLKANFMSRFIKGNALWETQETLQRATQVYNSLAMSEINRTRNEQLADVLQTQRRTMHQFWDALKARNSKTQEERFRDTDFTTITTALPIWLVTVDELSQSLPLHESLFDVVIFDEATQCDIASALPALYRAKRAVVAGDVKQLRHVSFLSRGQQNKFWHEEGLPEHLLENFAYRDKSLLDCVSASLSNQSAVTFLDEHYRSQADLIRFSNQYFYGNRLKIMQARPGGSQQPALEFIYLPEGQRTKTGRNSAEKEAVITLIQSYLDAFRNAVYPPKIGVISPFREQAAFIEKAVEKEFSYEVIQRHALRVSTPYGFQGEERDIMILSMAVDENSARAAAYLNREDMFNVMVTRARKSQVIFHSFIPEVLSHQNLLRQYLGFSHDDKATTTQQNAESFICDFTNQIKQALERAGIQYWVGAFVAGENIDVICQHGESTLGLDLIGYSGDFEGYFDLNTHRTFQRAGLQVLPVPFQLWQSDPERVLREIKNRLSIS